MKYEFTNTRIKKVLILSNFLGNNQLSFINFEGVAKCSCLKNKNMMVVKFN